MRVIADTNTIVSGLLWQGIPRSLLDAARSNRITLFTSPALLAELDDVLNRSKFKQRLASAGVTGHEMVINYAALATVVEPSIIPPVVLLDPDDDTVLACAIAANAECIVSGDSHLLRLREY